MARVLCSSCDLVLSFPGTCNSLPREEARPAAGAQEAPKITAFHPLEGASTLRCGLQLLEGLHSVRGLGCLRDLPSAIITWNLPHCSPRISFPGLLKSGCCFLGHFKNQL